MAMPMMKVWPMRVRMPPGLMRMSVRVPARPGSFPMLMIMVAVIVAVRVFVLQCGMLVGVFMLLEDQQQDSQQEKACRTQVRELQ